MMACVRRNLIMFKGVGARRSLDDVDDDEERPERQEQIKC